MPRQPDLLRALVRAGMQVDEVLGWQTRGSDTFNPRGGVHHHTAGPRAGVQPSLNICINGRPDLPGPLANVHLPREESLRCNLIAGGKANHAGLGGFNGLTGNSSVFGLEVEHCGYADEPISPIRIEGMVRVQAAFAYVGGFDPLRYTCQHYEWAPTRKIDFVHGLLDPSDFRLRVSDRLRIMRGGSNRTDAIATQPPSLEDLLLINDPTNGHTYILGPPSTFQQGSPPQPAGMGRLIFTGLSNQPNAITPTAAGMKSLLSTYGNPIYTP